MRKELKSSDLWLRLKSAAITIGLANIIPNDVRSILSTLQSLLSWGGSYHRRGIDVLGYIGSANEPLDRKTFL